MSDCEITDKYAPRSGASAGGLTPVQNAVITAVPGANNYRATDSGGTYRPVAANPAITTAPWKFGMQAQTDSSGTWTLYLPQKGSTRPSSPAPQWTIILPDGRQLYGEVPNVSGPLSLDDLINTYSWAWSNTTYIAPVTPGTLVRGIATFTAADYVDVAFTVSFATNLYVVKLTPSVDSGTGDIPAVAYSAKATSSFRINTNGLFTGTVDYEAVL